MAQPPTNHAVIIPSVGRPEVLLDTVKSVLAQTPPPDETIVAVHSGGDYLPQMAASPGVKVIKARLGSALQRNDAVAALSPGIEFVTFLDDDVELAPGYLANARAFLRQRPDVVLLGGGFIRNGGVSRPQAIELARAFQNKARADPFQPGAVLAGGNMTARCSVLNLEKFDERFRLYSWLEDADFGKRCLRHGQSGYYAPCQLVHLAHQGARPSDARMGFMQVMNPYYIHRKGLLGWRELLRRHWLRVPRNNFGGLLIFDRRVNRWQRLKGNCIALSLILRGRCEPEHVEKIS